MNIISIKSVIDGEFAIDPDDGYKLYDEMKKYLDKNQDFSLDFEGIKICIASFASFSIGKALFEFGEDVAQKIVDNAVNFTPQHKQCLDQCVRTLGRHSTIPAERLSAIADKMAQELEDGTWRDGMEN